MKPALYTGLLLLLLLIPGISRSQLILTPQQMLRGIVRDDSTGQALSYVQVYNESKRKGCISNEKGYFHLFGDIGDTLVFSGMSYLGKVQLVGDLDIDTLMEVRLSPRFYQIAEVKITRLGTYDEFKRSLLALELPKTQTRILREHLFEQSHLGMDTYLAEEEVRKAMSPEPGKPTGGISIPILSREEKQRLNLAKVMEKEKEQELIDAKYNRDIIRKVTHLPDDEIIDFMGFCHFSNEVLLQATDYEIVLMIEKKFKEYQNRKSKGELKNGNAPDTRWLASIL